MKRHWLFVSLVAIVCTASVSLMAENNCQKCNKPASCTMGCTGVYYPAGSSYYHCSEVVAHASPGKVCEAGGKDDNCTNNLSVPCGKAHWKSCTAGKPLDCTGPWRDEWTNYTAGCSAS